MSEVYVVDVAETEEDKTYHAVLGVFSTIEIARDFCTKYAGATLTWRVDSEGYFDEMHWASIADYKFCISYFIIDQPEAVEIENAE